MKKIILTIAFIGIIGSINATNLIAPPDCHAEACEFVGFMEEHYGDLDEIEANFFYDMVYNECML